MGGKASKALKTVGSFIPGVGQVIGAFDALDAAEENEKNLKRERQETDRRMAAEAAQRAGQARAMIGASGARPAGSLMQYMEGMEAEDERQRKFMRKAGKSREEIARLEGESAFYQGIGQGVQQAASWWG